MSMEIIGMVNMQVNFLPPPPYNSGDSLVVTFSWGNNTNTIKKITDTNYLNWHQRPNAYLTGTWYVNIDKFKSGNYTNIKDTVFYVDGTSYNYDVNW